ncbi:hypothetical protein [Dyadobacter psychrotolerans]|uniref:Uncharacterized protein n=1 Tax=Dyadobacter psychrotolerans TaxID=2541721 RepID=A0A4R5DSP3_9BACT|nr:hypothetical protein [Dyadobacter psychrotolerans]TDE15290.1 hypothetical protein E0F88_12260 [Dyadobacter psychrotolerans]
MDVKLITNIGYYGGAAGQGIIYVGKSTDGQYAAMIKVLENNAERFTYMRRSQIETLIGASNFAIQSDFNLSKLIDTVEPNFVTAGSGNSAYFPTITNVTGADGLPRLFLAQAAYTLKGAGVTLAEIDELKTKTAVISGTDTATGTTPATSSFFPSDFSGLSNPFKFMQDYPWFTLFVAIVLYVTLTKSGKKALKRIF